MESLIIKQKDEGKRLDKVLCEKFDISFGIAQKIIRQKRVKINGQKVDYSYKLAEGDELQFFVNLDQRKNLNLKNNLLSKAKILQFKSYIIYENDDFVALNKPSGLAVQGGSGIKYSVADFAQSQNWFLVHRLDKDTSGILLIAKNKKASQDLIEKFKNKKIKKFYQAYILGFLKKDHGVIDIPLKKKFVKNIEKTYPDFDDGKEAITKFKLLKKFHDYSLVSLEPVTGRTHQLRVHMKEMGCPIINDVKYGGKKTLRPDISKNLCLQAKKIIIDDIIIEI